MKWEDGESIDGNKKLWMGVSNHVEEGGVILVRMMMGEYGCIFCWIVFKTEHESVKIWWMDRLCGGVNN